VAKHVGEESKDSLAGNSRCSTWRPDVLLHWAAARDDDRGLRLMGAVAPHSDPKFALKED
jgi:hypothetical protein